jgi:hypothetical protein
MSLHQLRVSPERRLPKYGGVPARGDEWARRVQRAVAAIQRLPAETWPTTCGHLSERIDEGDIFVTCEALELLADDEARREALLDDEEGDGQDLSSSAAIATIVA